MTGQVQEVDLDRAPTAMSKFQLNFGSGASIFHFTAKSDLKLLIPAICISVIDAIQYPILTILIGNIFNALADFNAKKLTPKEFMDKVLIAVIGIFSIGAAVICLSWMSTTLWGVFGDRQTKRARRKVFRSFIFKEMAWFDGNTAIMGQLSMANRNIEDLRMAVALSTNFITNSCLTIVFSMALALYKCWSLALVSLAGIPIIALVGLLTSRPINTNLETHKSYFSAGSDVFHWAISSVDTVKMFNAQKYHSRLFKGQADLAYKFYVRFINFMCAQQGINRVLVLSMFVQAFFFGSYLVKNHKIRSGDVLTVFWSCITVAECFHYITTQMVFIRKGQTASKSLQELLSHTTDPLDRFKKSIGLYPSHTAYGAIVFKNISFKYPSRSGSILTNFNLTIAPNETTFIVGESGSGKSTIANLLLKIYSDWEGDIFFDGFPLATLSARWIFDNVAVVEQQSSLFDATIEENIKMGAKDPDLVTDGDVRAAAEAALCDFIKSLPDGFKTKVGKGGSSLSGGQQQRIALARAFISNSPVMIFDEAVSALDIQLRAAAIQRIKQIRGGKTTIFITHEFSQIGSSDMVYVIRNGQVAEAGIKKDLENSNLGSYQRMANAVTASNSDHLLDPRFRSTVSTMPARLSTARHSILPQVSHIEQQLGVFFGDSRHKPTDEEAEIETQVNEWSKRKIPLRRIILDLYNTIPHKQLFYLGLFNAVIHSLVSPAFSYAFSNLLAGIVPTASGGIVQARPVLWALIVLALSFLDGITTYGKVLMDIVAERWVRTMRVNVFIRLLEQDVEWFSADAHSTAALTNLVMCDIEDARQVITRLFSTIASVVALCTCATAWALSTGWKLSLVGFSLLPFFYLISKWFTATCEKWEAIYHDSVESIISLMDEAVSGIKTVKSLNLEIYFLNQFATRETILKEVGLRRAVYVGLGLGLSQILTYLSQGILLYYGMQLISDYEYSAKQALFVFSILTFSLASIEEIFSSLPQLGNGFNAFAKTNAILSLNDDSAQEKKGRGYHWGKSSSPEIEFQEVCFGYGRQEEIYNRPVKRNAPLILRNVSFKIYPNEVLALVGASGSGKSTILDLVTKLYLPESGKILCDGIDIKDISTADLRSSVAIVHQMPIAFLEDTIMNNLKYACDDEQQVMEQQVMEACQECDIHDFISTRLEDKYDTIIGANSAGSALLSGGQLQRLGIARALLRRPRILILDECTSALDLESISNIQRLILKHKEARDMTILMITHQKEMIGLADRVVHTEDIQCI
ncbi:alpha-factor-transporting ATPase [Trichomonascus vanleenenianus]|uniref:ABC transporter ATP-binding protein n=1 Tax=Trichomonascus vanleenenianus TaxID=2268995 RepID=UPI003ECA5E41